MRRSCVILAIVVLLSAGVLAPSAQSQGGRPLPPLPPADVRMAVLDQTGGAQFFALKAPNFITRDLGKYGAPFSGVQGLLDVSQTVNYFDMEGVLREAVMPLKDSRTSELAPTMAGLPPDGLPGQVIAAIYDPAGAAIVAAMFGPNDELPQVLRFYRSDRTFEEQEAVVLEFEDLDQDELVEMVDDGAIVASDRTCVAVGLMQVCWQPLSEEARDPAPMELTDMAGEHLRSVYEFDATFNTEQAMPDIIGRADRGECARNLAGARPFAEVPGCVPNLAFAASEEETATGAPIALFVVMRPADVRTFNAAGEPLDVLPPGEYLVLDATPESPQPAEPGDPALLFLVSAKGEGYLVPAVVMQGFGQGELDQRQAAIKDGYASYRGWGY